MGYKSNIFIIIYKNLEENFSNLLKQYDLESSFEKEREYDHIKYKGSWLKWYDSFEDVKAVETFINNHKDKAGLLGIGEDGAESARAGDPDRMNMWVVSDIDW